MVKTMEVKELASRFWGIPVAITGMILIVISGELLSIMDPLNTTSEIRGLLLRGGFGVLLVGILSVFLLSSRSIPREVTSSYMSIQGRNLGRFLEALNLQGRGVYFPPVGRLTEDRVYIPLEKHDLPLPDMADTTVLNVGSTDPSMGVSILPPGKGFVDTVESLTDAEFANDDLVDGTESLERLSKGTGIIGNIELKNRKGLIELSIRQREDDEICQAIWKDHGGLHSQVGCPLCSSVLCATARMAGIPLRIRSVERNKNTVYYKLEKVTR